MKKNAKNTKTTTTDANATTESQAGLTGEWTTVAQPKAPKAKKAKKEFSATAMAETLKEIVAPAPFVPAVVPVQPEVDASEKVGIRQICQNTATAPAELDSTAKQIKKAELKAKVEAAKAELKAQKDADKAAKLAAKEAAAIAKANTPAKETKRGSIIAFILAGRSNEDIADAIVSMFPGSDRAKEVLSAVTYRSDVRFYARMFAAEGLIAKNAVCPALGMA